jgi:hypothetical protein
MIPPQKGQRRSRCVAAPILQRTSVGCNRWVADFVGVLQEVYDLDEAGRRTHVRPKLKAELRGFARTWFRNLRAQGFLERDVRREVLA